MAMMNQMSNYGPIYMFRGDHMGYTDMEKRQLFLRSYQFSRKKSLTERMKRSFFKVKRVVCFRLRSARKIRKMVWSRLRHGFFCNRRRRFFLRLHHINGYYHHGSSGSLSWPSSCFW